MELKKRVKIGENYETINKGKKMGGSKRENYCEKVKEATLNNKQKK